MEDMSESDASARDPLVTDEIVEASVRRAPKYGVFLGLGAALGVLVAMILTFAFDGSAETSTNTGVQYSQVQVFGFLALVCIGAGLLIGGIVALVFERTLGRRSRVVSVDRERVVEQPEHRAPDQPE